MKSLMMALVLFTSIMSLNAPTAMAQVRENPSLVFDYAQMRSDADKLRIAVSVTHIQNVTGKRAVEFSMVEDRVFVKLDDGRICRVQSSLIIQNRLTEEVASCRSAN